MKNSPAIAIAVIIGGVVLAVATYFYTRGAVPMSKLARAELLRAVDTNDHILGDPSAPIVIVSYSDFDCEFCKNFDETLRQIVANEGLSPRRGDSAKKSVAVVFREFPLTELHPNAFSHAMAAECAAATAGESAFWDFVHEMFARQPVDPARYGAVAAAVGISGNEFASCVAEKPNTLFTRISADRQNALEVGARGTPYSVVFADGVPVAVMDGAYSYDAVKQLVNDYLVN